MAKQAEKPDIRVQFTRKTLRDSLIGLMETKSILQISIKEICERAGVSRSTFYTYYNDQFDLLRQIEDQSFMDSALMRQKYKGIKRLGNQGVLRLFEEVLRHIADNRDSIQVLFSENGDTAYQKRLMHKGLDWVREVWGIYSNEAPDAKIIEYHTVFWMGGAIAFLQKWLKSGMDIPIPDIAKMLAKLIAGRR